MEEELLVPLGARNWRVDERVILDDRQVGRQRGQLAERVAGGERGDHAREVALLRREPARHRARAARRRGVSARAQYRDTG